MVIGWISVSRHRKGGRSVRAWRVHRHLEVPAELRPCRFHVVDHQVVDVARHGPLGPRPGVGAARLDRAVIRLVRGLLGRPGAE